MLVRFVGLSRCCTVVRLPAVLISGCACLLGQYKVVTDFCVGNDKSRVGWVGLDLLSKWIDTSSEVFKFNTIIRSPDGLQHTPAWRLRSITLPKGSHSSPPGKRRFLSASNANSPHGGIGSCIV